MHAHDLAWDCATGTGQCANQLAKFIRTVHATDSSKEQLGNSAHVPNINYYQSDERNPKIESGTVDLVTVATAIHWLNTDVFFKEAERVLKSGGLLAVWGYTGINISGDLDSVLHAVVNKYLTPYYPKNIEMAFGGYQGLELPFNKIETPDFYIELEWTFEDFQNYILTWSASQNYIKLNKQSPMPLFINALQEAWGDVNSIRKLRWDLITHFCRK
jgi:ubiquinone/menaquinone biosynthesis C-methylase UbiE